jgi:hypothetical protein
VKKRQRTHAGPSKRRTTLTLPSDALSQAERIARDKNVNLSTVVAEALSNGLKMHMAAERADRILSDYKRAFEGFSDQEILLLDGVLLEPAKRRGR